MTDKEILQRAIGIAKMNGCPITFIDISLDEWLKHQFYYRAIFDHEFAKALWGEVDDCADIQIYSTFNKNTPYRWQYHLSKMVLEKEPLKYLEKFL